MFVYCAMAFFIFTIVVDVVVFVVTNDVIVDINKNVVVLYESHVARM